MSESQKKSDFVIVVGPGHGVFQNNELKDFEEGLKKQGANVVRVGDGQHALNDSDLDQFYKNVSAAEHPKIVIWGHGNVFDDKHIIELKNGISNTEDIISNINQALKNKEAEILLISCHAGGIVPNIENHIPKNMKVYTLVNAHDVLYNIDLLNMISTMKDTQLTHNNLTIRQLLIAFLVSNEIYSSNPEIYPKQDYSNPMDMLALIPGKKFTPLEKQNIVSELAKFTNKEDVLKFLSLIEATNEPLEVYNYGQLLALSLICARTETYKFNTDALTIAFNTFFNTVGQDLIKSDNPILRNMMKVLKTAHIAHPKLLPCLLQENHAQKENEGDYLNNILLNKYAPFLKAPKTFSDLINYILNATSLIQGGLSIESIWRKPDDAEDENSFRNKLSEYCEETSLAAKIGWAAHDFVAGTFDLSHPVATSLALVFKNYLLSVLESKLLEKGHMPESGMYYFLRQEAIETAALLGALLQDLTLDPSNMSGMLATAINAIELFSNMVEIAYKYHKGSYDNDGKHALLLNLLMLNKTGKANEIVEKLKQLDWVSEPVSDNDDAITKEIKAFAHQFEIAKQQGKTVSPSISSTSFLLEALKKVNPVATKEELLNSVKTEAVNISLPEETPQPRLYDRIQSGLTYFGGKVLDIVDKITPEQPQDDFAYEDEPTQKLAV